MTLQTLLAQEYSKVPNSETSPVIITIFSLTDITNILSCKIIGHYLQS